MKPRESSPVREGRERRTPTAGGTRLSVADALARCRSELRSRLAGGRAAERPDLASVLRQPVAEFAVIASREQIPPERALVLFKKMLSELADLRGLGPARRDDLLRQLVEVAIESYYADPAAARHLLPAANPRPPVRAP